MRFPITWLSPLLLLGMPVLAVIRYSQEDMTTPKIGLGRAEAGNPTKHDQVGEDLKSLREDVDRQNQSMLRMDLFAKTMLQRLLVLESKHKGDNTRKGIEQVSSICSTTPPPPREGASVNKTLTDNGLVAKYSCRSGYINIGGNVLKSTCDAAENWSQVDISCNNLTTCYHRIGSRLVYGGTTANTWSGRTCQKWRKKRPHRHGYGQDINFSRTSLAGAESIKDVSNFCRDPGAMKGSGKLWCYTTDPDKRWEECNIPKCETASTSVP
ncbi:plasminogen-like [Haliotis rufescens]|uniref:plasminogen-like n=1 Tax=Haliotis rufescens TaxID=6454 RepID=UPI001EB07ED9|nr:plasminogen-like [Haliotis rufescens]